MAVVEADGFSALSLRSVARQLEVGPMTLYTYVDGSEELAALVVDRLVGEAVQGLRLPRSWRAVLRLLAKKLDALVTEHPAMVEAFGRGMVGGRASNNVGDRIVERLVADGLSTRQAAEAYIAVHALVLGCAVLRAGGQQIPLDAFVETLLDGVADGP